MSRLKSAITLVKKDERVRFLFIGILNTVFGYLTFTFLQYFWGPRITIFGSLYISHAIASTVAFVLYRKFVFHVQGHLWHDFGRFQLVYVLPLLVNTFLLPALILWFSLNVYIAQALTMAILTVGSYLGHKFFSFRRKKLIYKSDGNGDDHLSR